MNNKLRIKILPYTNIFKLLKISLVLFIMLEIIVLGHLNFFFQKVPTNNAFLNHQLLDFSYATVLPTVPQRLPK